MKMSKSFALSVLCAGLVAFCYSVDMNAQPPMGGGFPSGMRPQGPPPGGAPGMSQSSDAISYEMVEERPTFNGGDLKAFEGWVLSRLTKPNSLLGMTPQMRDWDSQDEKRVPMGMGVGPQIPQGEPQGAERPHGNGFPKAAGIGPQKMGPRNGGILLTFTLNKKGLPKGIEVTGADKELEKELESIVSSSPQWVPAREDGKNVKVKVTMMFQKK